MQFVMLTNGFATTERSGLHIARLQHGPHVKASTALTPEALVGRIIPFDKLGKDALIKTVLVVGGAASGKSTLARAMQDVLAARHVVTAVMSSDDYLRGDRGMRRTWEADGRSPDEKYDFDYMRAVIDAVRTNRDARRHVIAPKYDAKTGLALGSNRRRYIPPVGVLIVEGDMLGERGSMPDELFTANDFADDPHAIYLHVPDTRRLALRLERDMQHRNGHGETTDIIVANFEQRQLTQHLPYTLGYAAVSDSIVQPAVQTMNDGMLRYDLWQMQPQSVQDAHQNF
jgi:uridine kinase